VQTTGCKKDTEVRRLGRFVAAADSASMTVEARDELRKRILDSVGVAIGALDGDPIRRVRDQLDDFGGRPIATLIGGGKTAPDRAAFYNGALVRYLDFMDSYLAKGETCHASDNLGAVLAAVTRFVGAGQRRGRRPLWARRRRLALSWISSGLVEMSISARMNWEALVASAWSWQRLWRCSRRFSCATRSWPG